MLQFMRDMLDQGKSQGILEAPILLCGDLNVNSLASEVYLKEHLGFTYDKMSDHNNMQLFEAISEYSNMIESFTNFNQWEVVDCFEENEFNTHLATFEKESNGKQVIPEYERLDYCLFINPNGPNEKED